MLFRVSERLFVLVLFLNSMGVVAALTNPAHAGPRVVSSNLHMTSIAADASVNFFGTIFVLMRWRRVLRVASTAWPLIVLIALAPVSMAWSVDPIVTMRRSALLVVSTMIAIYLGERYSIEKLARLMSQTLCLMMLMSIACRFVASGYVIDDWGQWRGLSGYKNAFGEYMAESVALLLVVRFRYFRWTRYLFLFIAAVLLLLSHSATALFGCVSIVAMMPLWRAARINGARRYLAYAVFMFAFLLTISFLGGNTGLLFQLLGRDSTLTGRTQLWSVLLSAIAKHPFLGYGYGAFWTSLRGEALDVWIGNGWLAPVADNGYLDLCIGLGLVGVFAFGFLILRCLFMGMNYLRSEPTLTGLWPISFFCFFVLHNLGESTLLTTGTFPYLVFASLAASLSISRRQPYASSIGTDDSRAVVQEWMPQMLSN